MLVEFIKAVLGMLAIVGGWLAVQRAWRRAFPGAADDDDPLQGRLGCHGCSCETPCETPDDTQHDTQHETPDDRQRRGSRPPDHGEVKDRSDRRQPTCG